MSRKILLLILFLLLVVYAPRPAQAQPPPPSPACTPTADFNISASPDFFILQQSGSGTSTITLTPIDGFAGTVTLSTVSVPPEIINPALSSTTLDLTSGPQTSTLTFTMSSTVAPGEFFFDVNATTTGILFHTTTIHIRVSQPPQPGFGITPSKFFLTIPEPTTGAVDITLTSLNGFADSVALTATIPSPHAGFNLPTVTPSFTMIPLSAGGKATQTLTISTTPSTTPGYYRLGVSGKGTANPAVSNSTSVFVTVTGPDFGIDSNPIDLVVLLGTSQDSKVNITSIEKFSGTVSLTRKVFGFPGPAPMATLSTSSIIVPSGSFAISTLTVTATPTTGPGDYLVTVNGTSTTSINGPLIHLAYVFVTVPGAPGFSITPNPDTLAVKQGSPVTSIITLKSLNSFTDSIELSVGCFPGGLTASINPGTISVNPTTQGTATLTVSASSFTIPGTYHVDIDGFGTTTFIPNSTTVEVTVTGPHFTLTASPNILSLNVGSMATPTVTATSKLGFTGTVKLTSTVDAITGPATGLTATLSPTSLDLTTATRASSTLTLTGNAPGYYIVQVDGISWPLTNTTSIIVTVTAPTPDFSLNANPSSLTIVQGSSQQSTISMSALNGFTGTVNLSSMPQTGITTNFLPPSIYGPQTSILTVNVASTVAAGPYTIDVTGTSGSLVRHLPILVTVTAPAPEFSISAGSVTPATIPAGGSGTSIITITPHNAFTGTVTFTVSPSTPTGLACQKPADLTMGAGTSTLSCTASAAGDYTVTVTGSSGTLSHTTSNILFHVVDFTIDPTTALTVSCNTGNNCPTPITITAQNGFSDTVSFTVSRSTGLTCSTPTSVTGSGHSTLSCGSSSTGDFTVTVSGTSGTLSHSTAIITYHVVVVPEFTITASVVTPSTILAGGSGTSTITISSVNGFAGTVSFTVSASTPAGLACVKPLDVIYGSGTSTLSCSAVTPGDYTVIVTGTATISGSLVTHNTASIRFHVTDFSIAASSPADVNPGQSATSTITITAINSFTGTVILAASPSAGLTCSQLTSFTLSSSPGTSTLSCSASAVGDYIVTVTGASGTLSHTATITVHVVALPTPDFAVTLSSSSQSFNSGSSATTTITITPSNGFAGTVTLTVSAPAGVSCNLAPTTLQPSGAYPTSSSTLTCTSSSPGDYTVTVNASGGATPHQTTVTIHVASAPSQVPPSPSTIFGLQPIVFYAIVGVIIAVVAAGAGATVMLRRRKP